MQNHSFVGSVCVLLCVVVAACGDDGGGGDPTDVRFGETAIVVMVNPAINDANDVTMAEPGDARAGVTVSSDDGAEAVTDAEGVAVLGPLAAGTRTITLSGSNVDGSISVTLADGELRELAVAADTAGAEVMVEVDYRSEQLVMITPDMTNSEVNDALSVSDTVVFVKGGDYVGDIDFSGSRVTLFGEGLRGGAVTLDGNVTMNGSDSRIRGAHITGTLSIPASGIGLSFSRVDGQVSSEGSDATLLGNDLCGGVTITGSGSAVVGNDGVAPTTSCP